jgi:hypothetical protein
VIGIYALSELESFGLAMEIEQHFNPQMHIVLGRLARPDSGTK